MISDINFFFSVSIFITVQKLQWANQAWHLCSCVVLNEHVIGPLSPPKLTEGIYTFGERTLLQWVSRKSIKCHWLCHWNCHDSVEATRRGLLPLLRCAVFVRKLKWSLYLSNISNVMPQVALPKISTQSTSNRSETLQVMSFVLVIKSFSRLQDVVIIECICNCMQITESWFRLVLWTKTLFPKKSFENYQFLEDG